VIYQPRKGKTALFEKIVAPVISQIDDVNSAGPQGMLYVFALCLCRVDRDKPYIVEILKRVDFIEPPSALIDINRLYQEAWLELMAAWRIPSEYFK
jgi:hypothetical protein